MGPSPPARLLLGLTLFLTLTHATVTVYTPTQVAFTTAPAVSGTPAAYTGVAAYNPGTLSPPPLPSPTVLTNPIPINLLHSGTPGLGPGEELDAAAGAVPKFDGEYRAEGGERYG
ncbi:hypothetical protein B0H16DRAFT_1690894 [Mycena metata]|uniref:Uncharacterized protein n=1 Tax=Mycena metata TaxID=1033252 RepID=A0AAD7NAR8_9AGAR|nr:hypothetical protein B0H16DRAFT_1690894 [Mycena metata]